jgi:3-deoxy-D-manno-octulosonate 8-phosphate phosphatase (KDO 8-P phosphatase)
MPDIKKNMLAVKAFVFDVDGVFTNGAVMLHPGGEFIRMMNIKDGFAVQHAVKMGYPIAVITGGFSKMVRKRFVALGVKDIFMKCSSKMSAFEIFLAKYNMAPSDILCMGDDLPDYEIMKKAGFPTCPSDAASEIIELSLYISDKKGGEGCVRDIIEQVLRVQGKWTNDFSFVW